MTDARLPQTGGSYTRDEKGALKQTQPPTKPAVKAKPAATKKKG